MKNAKVSWLDANEKKQEGVVIGDYLENGNTILLVEMKKGELLHVWPKSITLVISEEEQK